MSLKRTPEFPQRKKLLFGEVAGVGKCTVESRCGMSLTQYKPVPVRPCRILRIMSHCLKIEYSYNICCRKRASGMTGIYLCGHFSYIPADSLSCFCKFIYVHLFDPLFALNKDFELEYNSIVKNKVFRVKGGV